MVPSGPAGPDWSSGPLGADGQDGIDGTDVSKHIDNGDGILTIGIEGSSFRNH